jgi:hypothetical protein
MDARLYGMHLQVMTPWTPGEGAWLCQARGFWWDYEDAFLSVIVDYTPIFTITGKAK